MIILLGLPTTKYDNPSFPSGTDWQSEREKMKNICRACHGNSWINDFYDGFDTAIMEYNEVYFKPAKAKLDTLYEKGLLDNGKFFDERLEVEFYELWHHEGPSCPDGRHDDGPGLCVVARFL